MKRRRDGDRRLLLGAYVTIKVLAGRAGAVHPMMCLAAVAFVVYFALR